MVIVGFASQSLCLLTRVCHCSLMHNKYFEFILNLRMTSSTYDCLNFVAFGHNKHFQIEFFERI